MFNITKYKIPTEFIVSADMETLESYISIFDSRLQLIAMESSDSSNDQYAAMSAKARAAGKKIIEGQEKRNPAMISQGNSELSGVTKQLVTENKKATSFGIKAKLIIVAKVVIAVIGSVLLAFGLYKAGRAVKDFLSGKASKQEVVRAATSSTSVRIGNTEKPKPSVTSHRQQSSYSTMPDDMKRELEEAESRLVDAQKSAVNIGESIDRCIEMTQNNLKTVIGMMASDLDGTLKTPVEFTDGTNTKTVTTLTEFDEMIKNKNYKLQL